MLPHTITEKDGAFADTLFHHPSTACNEQNLDSVIVRPAEGGTLTLDDADKNDTYRVEGFRRGRGPRSAARRDLPGRRCDVALLYSAVSRRTPSAWESFLDVGALVHRRRHGVLVPSREHSGTVLQCVQEYAAETWDMEFDGDDEQWVVRCQT